MAPDGELRRLRGNIWKYFVFLLTNRRNYVPVLALYFLSLPDTTIQQIGLFTGIGWFAGFLFEFPSGYVSDRIGHKTALIMAKSAMLLSTFCFIIGDTLPFFIAGSALISIGFAFSSGTSQALLHNTLIRLGEDATFSIKDGKIKAIVSLFSAGMILLLPLLSSVSLLLPIQVYLVFDVVGLIIAFTLFTPKITYTATDIEGEPILSQLKRFRGTGFYLLSAFLGITAGLVLAVSPFKEPYTVALGFPIVMIGTIMAASRIIWFIIGHLLHLLKRLPLRRLLLAEMFFFASMFILIGSSSDPYLVAGVFALSTGYLHARRPLMDEYFLTRLMINKRYKATMLSLKSQVSKLLQTIFALLIAGPMAVSYAMGYRWAGIALFVMLLALYPAVWMMLRRKDAQSGSSSIAR